MISKQMAEFLTALVFLTAFSGYVDAQCLEQSDHKPGREQSSPGSLTKCITHRGKVNQSDGFRWISEIFSF